MDHYSSNCLPLSYSKGLKYVIDTSTCWILEAAAFIIALANTISCDSTIRNNRIAIPMDSLRMTTSGLVFVQFRSGPDWIRLHIVMLQHLIQMGFYDTALTFARETAITYPPPPSSLPPGFDGFDKISGFLAEWWSIFYDIYTRMDYKISENGEELAESSAQAEARAHVQAQAQVHNGSINTQAMAYTEARAQARSQATALPLDQRQSQANVEAIHNEALTHAEVFHAQAMAYAEAPALGHAGSQTLALPLDQAQAQSWTFANNGVATPNHYIHPMGPSSVQQHPALLLDQAQAQFWTFANNGVATPEHYIHPMGPSSVQQHPFCTNNTNIASQPVSGVRWTDEQLSVLRQGWASPAYMSNSRHNEQSSAQNSRQVRRRVNGPENETWTGSASNGASDRVST
ncbi:transcriptional corepressor LEUNIG_homolog-like protein [Tanacetum coccineum]|uniref:Transcriptional corepressor LEUNIG_homolog-like protein n=1 Tax=Tanacetum coccineum TaxID=301880 RepID=A0ABQ5BKC9_9ASTR